MLLKEVRNKEEKFMYTHTQWSKGFWEQGACPSLPKSPTREKDEQTVIG